MKGYELSFLNHFAVSNLNDFGQVLWPLHFSQLCFEKFIRCLQNTIYQILTGARIEWHDFEIIVVESNKQDKGGVTESVFFLLLCMWLVWLLLTSSAEACWGAQEQFALWYCSLKT